MIDPSERGREGGREGEEGGERGEEEREGETEIGETEGLVKRGTTKRRKIRDPTTHRGTEDSSERRREEEERRRKQRKQKRERGPGREEGWRKEERRVWSLVLRDSEGRDETEKSFESKRTFLSLNFLPNSSKGEERETREKERGERRCFNITTEGEVNLIKTLNSPPTPSFSLSKQ